MVKLGQPMPPRPEGVGTNGKATHKQGFRLQVAMPKDLGGGVRELSSTAGCVIEAVDKLHDTFKEAPEAQAGKLPVVHISRVLPVKSGQSTNYQPVFKHPGVGRTAADARGRRETSAADHGGAQFGGRRHRRPPLQRPAGTG